MGRTYPVGVRQIDANGSRRILFTTQHCSTHGISRYTFHRFLFKTSINRRVVFKPLRIITYLMGALRGLFILIGNNAFPRTFQPEWVAILLNKTIDKVYSTLLFFQPFNRILVKAFQIACAIIVDKQGYHLTLLIILSHLGSLFKIEDNLTNGLTITAIHGPAFLFQSACGLHQLRVQAIRWRTSIGYIGLLCIVSLYFSLAHTFVEITSRR